MNKLKKCNKDEYIRKMKSTLTRAAISALVSGHNVLPAPTYCARIFFPHSNVCCTRTVYQYAMKCGVFHSIKTLAFDEVANKNHVL